MFDRNQPREQHTGRFASMGCNRTDNDLSDRPRGATADRMRQDGMKVAGIAKCEQLARMGDQRQADRIADLLGCIPERELGQLYGPQGARSAVYDGRHVYMVEFHGDDILRCDNFDPVSLPDLDDETGRQIAQITIP